MGGAGCGTLRSKKLVSNSPRDSGEEIYLKISRIARQCCICLFVCVLGFFFEICGINFKRLQSAQMHIFSATFSSSDQG